jgi:hypothetical protein
MNGLAQTGVNQMIVQAIFLLVLVVFAQNGWL